MSNAEMMARHKYYMRVICEVECPHCGAPKGAACRSVHHPIFGGGKLPRTPHTLRLFAARNQQAKGGIKKVAN